MRRWGQGQRYRRREGKAGDGDGPDDVVPLDMTLDFTQATIDCSPSTPSINTMGTQNILWVGDFDGDDHDDVFVIGYGTSDAGDLAALYGMLGGGMQGRPRCPSAAPVVAVYFDGLAALAGVHVGASRQDPPRPDRRDARAHGTAAGPFGMMHAPPFSSPAA